MSIKVISGARHRESAILKITPCHPSRIVGASHSYPNKIAHLLLFFTFLALESTQVFAAKADSNKPVEAIKMAPSREAKESIRHLFTPEELQIKKVETQIRALNLIIKTEKDSRKRIDLFIQRSQLQLSASRSLALKREAQSAMTPIEIRYLDTAKKTLIGLIPLVSKKRKVLADVHYLLGLVEYEYDHKDLVKSYFYKALEFNPNHPFMNTMSIILGELEFEIEDFQKAISAYQKFYPKLSKKEKVLADYKTAWSYVGLNDYAKAQMYLLRIIKNKFDNEFVLDSLKDLAFLIVQEGSESSVVEYGINNLPDLTNRSRFYYFALVQYLAKDKKIKREQLFKELQRIESDPMQIARNLYLQLQFEKREYPTIEGFKAMRALDDHLTKLNADQKSKFLFQDGAKLEDDSESMIKNFIDGYLGKLNRSEDISKIQLIEAAKKLIEIHLRIFPNAPRTDLIYSFWLDACFETKDEKCMKHLRDLFYEKKSAPSFAELYGLASLKLIVLVDEQYLKNPSKHENNLILLIEEFLKQNPKHAERGKLLKKISAIFLKQEKYDRALPYLEELQKTESSSENLNQLLFAKFKLDKYSEVVTNEDVGKYQNSEIQNLLRESSLRMAQKSIESGKFDEYETYLKKFLRSNPDDDKGTVAYLDYYDRLLKAKQLAKFQTEWKEMKPSLKKRKEFYPIRKTAITQMLFEGQELQDPTIVSESPEDDLNFSILLFKLSHEKFSFKEIQPILKKLSIAKRQFIMGLFLYTHPQIVEAYFEANAPSTNDDKLLFYHSLIAKNGNDRFEFSSANEYQLLKMVVPTRMKPKQKSKLLPDLAAYRIPKKDLSPGRYSKQTENLAENLRFIRRKAGKELPLIGYPEQMKLLDRLIELEGQTAQAILDSPLPADLSAEQKEEYQKGLSDLASEFSKQSEEYQKTKEILVKQNTEDADRSAYETLPDRHFDDMPLPKSQGPMAKALGIFAKNNLAGFIHWDMMYANSLIPVRDYLLGKVQLGYRVSRSEGNRLLLGKELLHRNESALLEEIRTAAGLPNPKPASAGQAESKKSEEPKK